MLRAALDLFRETAGPVLRDFPDDAESGDQPPSPLQASAVAAAAGVPEDPVSETAQMLRHHREWQTQHGGRTAFGLSRVPAEKFADAVLFLRGFAAGEDVDMPERSSDVALLAFIRWCADDLKTIYFEGHLAMKPAAGGEEVARWFWSETAAGQLLRCVRDRLDASDDPRSKAAAFGIAR